MIKVTNKLNLTDGANEDTILGAITEVQNKLDISVALNKANKEALDKMKNDMDDATNKYNAAKKELDETKDAAMEEKCKNMVTAFAKVGRIKNEAGVIAKWVAMAKVAFDETKNMIEELPLNKDAIKIDRVEEPAVNKVHNMAVAMANISAKAGQRK